MLLLLLMWPSPTFFMFIVHFHRIYNLYCQTRSLTFLTAVCFPASSFFLFSSLPRLFPPLSLPVEILSIKFHLAPLLFLLFFLYSLYLFFFSFFTLQYCISVLPLYSPPRVYIGFLLGPLHLPPRHPSALGYPFFLDHSL